MVEITLSEAEVSIGTDPSRTLRLLVATDKASGIRLILPMDRLAAVKVGQMLLAGAQISENGKD